MSIIGMFPGGGGISKTAYGKLDLGNTYYEGGTTAVFTGFGWDFTPKILVVTARFRETDGHEDHYETFVIANGEATRLWHRLGIFWKSISLVEDGLSITFDKYSEYYYSDFILYWFAAA